MTTREADIRVDILVYLYAARPVRRTIVNIELANRRNGQVRDAKAVEIERELAYLEGKGLCDAERRELDQRTKEYGITSAGVDHMEREGLI